MDVFLYWVMIPLGLFLWLCVIGLIIEFMKGRSDD